MQIVAELPGRKRRAVDLALQLRAAAFAQAVLFSARRFASRRKTRHPNVSSRWAEISLLLLEALRRAGLKATVCDGAFGAENWTQTRVSGAAPRGKNHIELNLRTAIGEKRMIVDEVHQDRRWRRAYGPQAPR